jgi:hypothetical protein
MSLALLQYLLFFLERNIGSAYVGFVTSIEGLGKTKPFPRRLAKGLWSTEAGLCLDLNVV